MNNKDKAAALREWADVLDSRKDNKPILASGLLVVEEPGLLRVTTSTGLRMIDGARSMLSAKALATENDVKEYVQMFPALVLSALQYLAQHISEEHQSDPP